MFLCGVSCPNSLMHLVKFSLYDQLDLSRPQNVSRARSTASARLTRTCSLTALVSNLALLDFCDQDLWSERAMRQIGPGTRLVNTVRRPSLKLDSGPDNGSSPLATCWPSAEASHRCMMRRLVLFSNEDTVFDRLKSARICALEG